MRPATAVSADGPMNLLNAIRLAAHPSARGKGVLVMMNDTIFSARNVTKGNTLSLDTFRSPDGPLGYMNDGHPCWCALPVHVPEGEAPFDVKGLHRLPRVYIIYGHAGADGAWCGRLCPPALKALCMQAAETAAFTGKTKRRWPRRHPRAFRW